MVECKPKSLWKSDTVIRKKESAIKFCQENNLIYKLFDTIHLTDEQIMDLYNKKEIKFIDRYEEKYRRKFQDN